MVIDPKTLGRLFAYINFSYLQSSDFIEYVIMKIWAFHFPTKEFRYIEPEEAREYRTKDWKLWYDLQPNQFDKELLSLVNLGEDSIEYEDEEKEEEKETEETLESKYIIDSLNRYLS